jgi:hypothetical protein
MTRFCRALVGVGVLTWVMSAAAQSGVLAPPPKVKLQTIDTSKAMSGTNSTVANNLTAPRARSPRFFSMGNFFPTISLASWPPKVPNVFQLPQKENPYQPNPPKGTNPFAAAPITSNRPGSVITIPGKVVTQNTK